MSDDPNAPRVDNTLPGDLPSEPVDEEGKPIPPTSQGEGSAAKAQREADRASAKEERKEDQADAKAEREEDRAEK